MTALSDTFQLLMMQIRTTIRIPIWIFVTLVQPVIWLALYGQLFRRVVDIPGFSSDSYIQFLTPGVVIMTAMFGSFWSGMGLIEALNDGVVDRLLATPIRRWSIIASRVLHAALTVTIQSVIILILGMVLGARIPGGVFGGLAIVVLAFLLGSAFSALSNGLALITRREETLIAIVNFLGLPLVFLSTAFMASDLMPTWIRTVAKINPVNWAVNGARYAMAGDDSTAVLTYILLLLGFVIISIFFSTRAFSIYQRST